MHDPCIIGMLQLFFCEHPLRIIAIYFSVITISTPILYIHEICILQCLFLIMSNNSTFCKLLVQFIILRMGDHKLRLIPRIDPLSKAVRHTLWQGLDMRSPGQYNFRFAVGDPGLLLQFSDRKNICKRL